MFGGQANDFLRGNGAGNALSGQAGNDLIQGLDGNDLISGDAGNDTLHGGAGDDGYVFANGWGNDQIVELQSAGDDTMNFAFATTNLTWTLGSVHVTDGTNNATHTGSHIEHLIGSSGNDTFVFQDQATLAGGTGTIDGWFGFDTLNYAAYTTPVSVNLALGTATGTGGVVRMESVVFPFIIIIDPFLQALDTNAESALTSAHKVTGSFANGLTMPAVPPSHTLPHTSLPDSPFATTDSGGASAAEGGGGTAHEFVIQDAAPPNPFDFLASRTLFDIINNVPEPEQPEPGDQPTTTPGSLAFLKNSSPVLQAPIVQNPGNAPQSLTVDAGTDANDGTADTIRVVSHPGSVEVFVNGTLSHTIPRSELLSLTVNGSADDDTFILDETDAPLAVTIHFDGDDGQNRLVVEGPDLFSLVHIIAGAGSGSLQAFTTSINYDAVSWVDTAAVNTQNYTVDLPDTDDDVEFLEHDGAVRLRSRDHHLPNVVFAAPGSSFTLNLGEGNDRADLWDLPRESLPLVVVNGGWGNDFVIGSRGTDDIRGDEGNDRLFGVHGDDIINGGPGNDYLEGNIGNDRVIGGTGDDTGNGGVGNDDIDGGEGNDFLIGFFGHDTINAGPDNDFVLGGFGDDIIRGGSGNDKLYGGPGNNVILGESGNDWISGGGNRDLIIGGKGPDILYGSGDDDILIAGTTDHDDDDTALRAILAEWTSSRSWTKRVLNIFGTGTGTAWNNRLNGNIFLVYGNAVHHPETVHDDDAVDFLFGGLGRDWLIW